MMADIRRTVKLSKRVPIDGGAWLEREGRTVKICYDYAGRLTKPDQHFYVEDIAILAEFVRETNEELAA
jgi:hypothetical protein